MLGFRCLLSFKIKRSAHLLRKSRTAIEGSVGVSENRGITTKRSITLSEIRGRQPRRRLGSPQSEEGNRGIDWTLRNSREAIEGLIALSDNLEITTKPSVDLILKYERPIPTRSAFQKKFYLLTKSHLTANQPSQTGHQSCG